MYFENLKGRHVPYFLLAALIYGMFPSAVEAIPEALFSQFESTAKPQANAEKTCKALAD